MSSISKKRASENSDYVADGGFVVDDSDDGQALPRSKKAKMTRASNSKVAQSNSGNPDGRAQTDSNGDQFWELSRLRRVTISDFKGKTLINVREYYEKDGQELPGKKGISMPVDQFSTLIKLLPEIETSLKKKSITLPRPHYERSSDPVRAGEDADEQSDVDSVDEENTSRRPSTKSSERKNIDATSDEDEDE